MLSINICCSSYVNTELSSSLTDELQIAAHNSCSFVLWHYSFVITTNLLTSLLPPSPPPNLTPTTSTSTTHVQSTQLQLSVSPDSRNKLKLLGIESILSLDTLSIGDYILSDRLARFLTSIGSLTSLQINTDPPDSSPRESLNRVHFTSLVELSLRHDVYIDIKCVMTLGQLTSLVCEYVRFPEDSGILTLFLPSLHYLKCRICITNWSACQAVVVTFPNLRELHFDWGPTLGETFGHSALWPRELDLHKLVALESLHLSKMPVDFIMCCASVHTFTMHIPSWCCVEEIRECTPLLSILGRHLKELNILSDSDMSLDVALSEFASACPHLTDMCIRGHLLDIGL